MSYFHSVFKRRANIATQIIEHGFDKITPTYYQTPLSNFSNLTQNFYLKNIRVEYIERITLFIKERAVQSFTGEFIDFYHQLRTPQQKIQLLVDSDYVIVPFKKHLPIMDDCKIVLELTESVPDVSLFVEYVFLDADPPPALMLVEQVQTVESSSPIVNLNLKHPVKEFYISVKDTEGNYVADKVSRIRIDINEFTKIDERALYFRYVQPLDYHTHVPGTFFTYSFCLDPESDLPTGSINMGRVKNQTIRMTYDGDYRITVYAINYNVLTPNGDLVFT